MRVLIVDDEKEVLDDLIRALKPAQYELKAEQNPVLALEAYQNEKFDVVISDIRMPEMNGIELLKRLRQFDKNARVIIITAYGDLETAKAAINNHAFAFFGKPINFNELMELLESVQKEINGTQEQKTDYIQLKEEFDKLKQTYEALLKYAK